MPFKEEGCSECKISMKFGRSKSVALAAMSYFTGFGLNGTSTGDESIMELTAKKTPTKIHKKSV